MLKALRGWFASVKPKSQRELDAEYLNDAVSIVDLENRLRELERRVIRPYY